MVSAQLISHAGMLVDASGKTSWLGADEKMMKYRVN
jgi:hypothetical protein